MGGFFKVQRSLRNRSLTLIYLLPPIDGNSCSLIILWCWRLYMQISIWVELVRITDLRKISHSHLCLELAVGWIGASSGPGAPPRYAGWCPECPPGLPPHHNTKSLSWKWFQLPKGFITVRTTKQSWPPMLSPQYIFFLQPFTLLCSKIIESGNK